jgi:hypothetical protein
MDGDVGFDDEALLVSSCIKCCAGENGDSTAAIGGVTLALESAESLVEGLPVVVRWAA